MQLNRKYLGGLVLAAITLCAQDRSNTESKAPDVRGPFCWAGKDGGKDRFIPCGPLMFTPSQSWVGRRSFLGCRYPRYIQREHR